MTGFTEARSRWDRVRVVGAGFEISWFITGPLFTMVTYEDPQVVRRSCYPCLDSKFILRDNFVGIRAQTVQCVVKWC